MMLMQLSEKARQLKDVAGVLLKAETVEGATTLRVIEPDTGIFEVQGEGARAWAKGDYNEIDEWLWHQIAIADRRAEVHE